MFFDLNNLKIVNDTMGHKYGDALIINFAHILRKLAPSNMFLGRIRGDEFIGILENTTKDEVQTFIEQLMSEAVLTNCHTNHNHIHIDFSFGYAFSSDYPTCTYKDLLDIADKKCTNKNIKKKPL